MKLIAIFVMIFSIACKDKTVDSIGPEHPHPLHTLSFEGTGVDLAVDNKTNLLVLSARDQGLIFFETSTADRPIEIGSIKLPFVYKALIKDKTVFGFDEEEGLSTIDLRELDQLNLVSALSSTELFGYVNDAILNESKLILANESVGLNSYIINDNIALIDQINNGSLQEPTQGVSSLAFASKQLITASFHGIISNYSWESNSKPKLLSSISTSLKTTDLACKKVFCFGASLAKGLSIIKIKTNGTLELTDLIELNKTIDLVFVDENLLYVSYLGLEDGNGWYVFDISSPSLPMQIRNISTKSPISDFTRVGENIYVLLKDKELQIFDREALKL